MSELDNLNKRLNYAGGNQEQRFIADKLRGLKKAMLYSYQAATAVLSDDREFRCLINPNKNKNDYDEKVLSIPFEDICLNKCNCQHKTTTEGIETIGLKGGDVFKWKETDTYWIIYLQYLEEDAYFRAEIRRCKETVTIDDTEYHVYLRGPVETTIQWNQKGGVEWSNLNYSLELYITKDEKTLAFFHRFKKIKINDEWWEIKAIDSYGGDGIIQVLLGETYDNEIEDKYYVEPMPAEVDTSTIYIDGKSLAHYHDILSYTVKNNEIPTGTWSIDNDKISIISQDSSTIKIEVNTKKIGTFNLTYTQEGNDFILPIQILA